MAGQLGLVLPRDRCNASLFLPDVDDLADVHVVDADAVALVPLALFRGHQVRIRWSINRYKRGCYISGVTVPLCV